MSQTAQQRRRTQRPPKAPPDLGTPETRAKLRPAPWAKWPDAHRYARAAQEIGIAFSIITTGLFAKAFEIGKVTGRINGESGYQEAAILRYSAWRAQLRPSRYLGVVIDLVVDGRPANASLEAILRDCLDLYLKLFPVPIDRRSEQDDAAAAP